MINAAYAVNDEAAGPRHTAQVAGGAVAVPAVDISRLLYDVNSTFNPLHPECSLNYHVEGLSSDKVVLSVSLQQDELHTFVQLLDTLHGLFRLFDNKAKARIAEKKLQDVDLLQVRQREIVQEQFNREVLGLFDQYTADGMTPQDAVKAVNRTMKEQGHPWAIHSLILGVVRSAGRLRKRRKG